MSEFLINLQCFYLKIRYLLFKNILKKKDFSNRTLIYNEDFNSLNNFEIRDKEFYNDNPVWFSKDTVYLSNKGVHIRCYKDAKTHTSWQGTRDATHTSGMITTRDTFVYPNGVWVVTAKPCNSWCAIWLLKRDRLEPNYNRTQITPEIDILEILYKNHKVKHGIAYGYSDTKYCTNGIGSKGIVKCDNKFHEYAVEILNNGYKFYIDGILTTKLLIKNDKLIKTNSNNKCTLIKNPKDFVTQCPNYILLNNASDQYTTENTEFVIKNIKLYE